MSSHSLQDTIVIPESAIDKKTGEKGPAPWSPAPLAPLFHPKTVAVIGATEKPASVGRTLLRNLLDHPFGATIFPVNPTRSNVLGIRCYPNISSIGEQIDLAVVVTPASTVPDVLEECDAAGVRGAVVISAGFAELGSVGKEREGRIRKILSSGRMRLIGPNCVGIMNPRTGLNATFAQSNALPGNIAFLSQSGALCTSILDWSRRENVGFSGFVSVGSMLDVSWGDLIYHFGDDPYTSSILIYMESIGDARSFLSAAREVSLRKPIIVIKPGQTEAARKAAASHTGSITGADEVFEAAFRRAGILRVSTIGELFDMAEVLSKQPRPQGPRLAVVTNAGGAGVLAADALLASGGQLAEITPETLQSLNSFLPEAWSHANPIDTLGDSGPEVYARALEVASKDPNCDAVLSILAPQGMTEPEKVATLLSRATEHIKKPLLASWMGGARMQLAANVLNEAKIPTFEYPDAAARSFAYMWRYSSNLQALYEAPEFTGNLPEDGPKRVADIIKEATEQNRTILTEHESKQILAAYELPVTSSNVVSSADDAVKAADKIGYPVVLKLHSLTVTHKSDRGGVALNLQNADAVRNAFESIRAAFSADNSFNGVNVQPMIKPSGYELILGSSTDSQFGPVMVFGLGGKLVEVLKDRAHALPALTTTLARRMMENTRIFQALKGVRGEKAVDIEKLEELLVRFSELVVENPRIADIEINPLLAGPDGIIALDSRVILHPSAIKDADLPRPAIRPYPTQYVSTWKANDGMEFKMRPIRPDDEALMVDFHHQLSEMSVYMRFFLPLKLDFRTSHERLFTKCFIDYDREIAIVAEYTDEEGKRRMAGVARLIRKHSDNTAEVAFLIADKFQNRGLGTHLLERMIEIARHERISALEGATLSDNYNMKDMFSRAGFRFSPPEDGVVTAILHLV
ncbi:MAG TPA: bifunctional acetate--CoA ligase family protein/GNAT family N-acetyltransferase [Candidatus Limnocylindrales bacterium]|nr:bifunctional acetate--CoA ligase family protein/GNAT family N-acetyltransferase [Candidatus Limnocylindrales bacterium]